MKKLVALFIFFALCAPGTASAALLINPPETDAAPPLVISGAIVDETEDFIEIISVSGEQNVILNLEARPYVVDCVTGAPVPLADRLDDMVIAYYGPVETRSFPPRSNPILIIVNIPQDYTPPRYGRVEELEKTDGSVKVTVEGGSMIVTIERDAPIFPYLTRNIVTIDNIAVGSDLLMWYPFVAMSYPGQATAQKTVLLGQTGVYEETADNPAGIRLFDECFEADGVTMVPLRLAAEALGFTVSWDDKTKTASVENENGRHSVSIGQDVYAYFSLEAAPVIVDGSTYVPLSFFETELGAECEKGGGGVTISL